MDEREFKQLAMAELDAVYRLACGLTRDSQKAEDSVQEVYLRALRAYSTFTLDENHGIRPWLFKILHHVVYNQGAAEQKQKKLMERLRQEQATGGDGDTDHDGLAVPSLEGIDWERVDERLKVAIDELPEVNRVAFLLSAVERLKYREIAEVTGVPVGTVMSRLFRARETLAARLNDLAIERRWSAPGMPVEDKSRKRISE